MLVLCITAKNNKMGVVFHSFQNYGVLESQAQPQLLPKLSLADIALISQLT